MHIGHMASAYRARTSSIFSNNNFRRFFQSGVICWLGNLKPLEPCCDLNFIGGDGTFVGIPIKNIPTSAQPAWQPSFIRDPVVQWKINERAGLTTSNLSRGGDFRDFHSQCIMILSVSTKPALRRDTMNSLIKSRAVVVEQCFVDELIRWSLLPDSTHQWHQLRLILLCLASPHSITGALPIPLSRFLVKHEPILKLDSNCENMLREMSTSDVLRGNGLGPEIIAVFRDQIACDGSIHKTTLAMVIYYGNCVDCFCLIWFNGNVTRYVSISISVAQAVLEFSSQIPNMIETKHSTRPDPATTGIRYALSVHGGSIRSEWPLSEAGASRMAQTDESCDGCKKYRVTYIGHRQRTGLWVCMCMIHETVVGYHLIHNSEGRRDALTPIYRFKENPPKACWYDFGCGCEESALNWLPEFYLETQFFHDCFHGFSHVCPHRFSSRRLPTFSSLNTSLMEQVMLY